MQLTDKRVNVDTLLELAKDSKLNEEQNNKILNIVKNLSNATQNQKDRFIMYYGIDGKGHKKLIEIAKLDNCSTSAVRLSIILVRNKLMRCKEEIEILEDIVKECTSN